MASLVISEVRRQIASVSIWVRDGNPCIWSFRSLAPCRTWLESVLDALSCRSAGQVSCHDLRLTSPPAFHA